MYNVQTRSPPLPVFTSQICRSSNRCTRYTHTLLSSSSPYSPTEVHRTSDRCKVSLRCTRSRSFQARFVLGARLGRGKNFGGKGGWGTALPRIIPPPSPPKLFLAPGLLPNKSCLKRTGTPATLASARFTHFPLSPSCTHQPSSLKFRQVYKIYTHSPLLSPPPLRTPHRTSERCKVYSLSPLPILCTHQPSSLKFRQVYKFCSVRRGCKSVGSTFCQDNKKQKTKHTCIFTRL